MRIRPATIGDAVAIAQIQIASCRSAYTGLLPQEYLDRFDPAEQQSAWERLILGPSSDVLLVADPGVDRLAGYALGRPIAGAGGPSAGELVALHVRAQAQRRGTGRRLVHAIARTLADRGATGLVAWVLNGNPAGRFYERLGGVPAGERTLQLDEEVEAVETAFVWADFRRLEVVEGDRLDLV